MRTEYCGLIDKRFLGKTVTLFGWVHRRRDHGGVIFIDLRDREGLVQVVFDPDRTEPAPRRRRACAASSCCACSGTVRPRPEGTENPNLPTGEIEVLADELEVLNPRRDAAVP